MEENTDFSDQDIDEDYGYSSDTIIEDKIEDFYEDEIEYKATFKAMQQMGPGVFLGTEISGTGDMVKLQAKLLGKPLSDEDNFRQNVELAVKTYSKILKKSHDFSNITKLIYIIPNIIRLNPTAFVLGYYILDNGEISKSKVDDVFKNVIKDIKIIAEPDVIRYARYIKKYI